MSAMMMTVPSHSATVRNDAGGSRFGRFMMKLIDVTDGVVERVHQRNTLAGLDDQMLKDIGLSRADVYVEYHKRFWQA